MQAVLVVLIVVLSLLAMPPYVIDTVKRKTKPERATWLILSVISLIGFFSELKLGVNWSLVFLGADSIGTLIVLGLSIPYGVGGFSLIDKYGLTVALVGLLISFAVNDPLIALLGIILADSAGTFLTVRKAFLDPGSETAISWLLVGVAAICGVILVGKWQFSLLLWPCYLVIANFSVPVAQGLGIINKRKVKLKRSAK